MNKKEKQKRKEAMLLIEQEAKCGGHNFSMGRKLHFFDVLEINAFGPHRQYSKYMSSRWNGK